MSVFEVAFGITVLVGIILIINYCHNIRSRLRIIITHDLDSHVGTKRNQLTFAGFALSSIVLGLLILLGTVLEQMGASGPLATHLGKVGGFLYLFALLLFLRRLEQTLE